MNEADTCRIYVEPKLREAGWETPPRSVASQAVIAPGKIIPRGKQAKRSLEGTIGSGGPKLTLHTSNGRISLRKR